MRLKITLAAALIASATAVQAADVHGIWRSETADDGGFIHVEIAPCSGNAALKCGTIIDAQNVDPANADPARRAELVGKVMIKDMAAESATEWSDGTIWAPDDDETYASTLELTGDVLIVSGCVLGGLICRGQDWTRVK